MERHFLSGKTIVVAGAGIAGLSFKIAMRKLWPSGLPPPRILMYEREPRVTPEGRDGYSISLAGYDETGGLFAARDMGILDQVLQRATPGLDGDFKLTLWDSTWKELLVQKYKPVDGLPTAGIRIARRELRNLLIEVAGTNDVTWGASCVGAKKLANGKIMVDVVNHSNSKERSQVECDLLVVADGASSKIRDMVRPEDPLQYTGIMMKGGLAVFPDGLPKPVDKNWGILLSKGQGVACFFSPYNEKSMAWGVSYRSESIEAPVNYSNPRDVQSVLDDCLELGKDFAEPFGSIIKATKPQEVSRLPAKDKQPFRHNISVTGPILFIGDSNHAVSPYAGYGASLAMKDGWDLSSKICEALELGDAVAAYDTVSVPRATKVIKESHSRIGMGHATGLSYYLAKTKITIGSYFV